MAQPNWYRKCVGCGLAHRKQELLRIVKNGEIGLAIDLAQNQPGRGAYVCRRKDCAVLAKKKKGLDRSLRCKIDSWFYDLLIKEIEKNEL